MKKNSSNGKMAGGFPSIAQGRYAEDFNMTTAEIAYHCDIRDLTQCPEQKEIEQSIIDKRVKHLEELQEKMKQ